jgi:hypothetical protein
MIGFQSPTVELELAKAVRADEIAAAQRYRLGSALRRSRRRSAASKNRGSLASTPRQVRPAAEGVGAPRRSSG